MVRFLINRPIAVVMTAIAFLLLGIFATRYIPVSLMPDIDIPEITIQVNDENKSAREIENILVGPLRNQMLQLSNLDDIQSESSNGIGIIKLFFTHGTHIQYAFIEVNEKVDRAMSRFPKEVDRPRVIRASATDIPVFYLNLTLKENGTDEDGKLTQEFIDFNRFTHQIIKKRIEQLEEVAMVDINGIVYPEILLIPDRAKITALGITLKDIEEAIIAQDITIGNVSVNDDQYQYNLRIDANLVMVKDIQNIYLSKNDKIFQLKEVATIIEHSKKRDGLVLYNDQESVAMAIIKQQNARMEDLKEALQETIKWMESDYPNIDFAISRDQTQLLDVAIGNLSQSLIWGVLLAFLVMFFFLKNVRSSILIGISVPISVIISLLFFYGIGLSVNIISLSGLVLGTGLMIDNSIIVIDNITQYINEGQSLNEACIKGTNEIFRPLLSSALTTCAVFIPLIFISGMTGALFYDQAMAITIGLFVSLIVSVTILPVLFRLFHLKKNKRSKIPGFFENREGWSYKSLYHKGFGMIMRNQKLAFLLFFVISILTVVLFITLPKTQMPELTQTDTLVHIHWNSPINVEENKERIITMMDQLPSGYIEKYNAFVGKQQFLASRKSETRIEETTLYLKTNSEPLVTEIKDKITTFLPKKYPEAIVEFNNVDNIFNLIFSEKYPPLMAGLYHPGQSTTENYEQLQNVYSAIHSAIPNKELMNPIHWNEQLVLFADKEKMLFYDVSENALLSTLESAFRTKEVLTLTTRQELVPVIIGDTEQSLKEVLANTLVQAENKEYLPLNQFVIQIKSKDLGSIHGGEIGEYYPVNLEIDSKQERSYKEKIQEVVARNNFFDVFFDGSIYRNRKLVNELALILGITLLLLYFILASQFESLTLPFIILMEIPIATAGAFIFLALFGKSLNLMSMIGIVVMSGIVVNDSILKIDTTIRLQKEGKSLLRALLIAGNRRLKPIFMTSLTTILALIPILFTRGIGGELQTPLAIALIGGMIVGTLVSLYFIPLCYFHLSRIHKRIKI